MPLLVLLVLCQTQYAWGQAALGQQIRTNINRSRAPTDFLSRLRVRSIYLRLAGDAQLLSTQFSGQYALFPSLALRLLVPLVHVDSGVAGMSPRFGLGDLRTRTLWRVWHTPLTATFIGVDLFFPTATDPLLGTEKYSIAPIAAFLYQIRKYRLTLLYFNAV